MSDYQERVDAFAIFGPGAITRAFADHSELLLSISERDASEKIVSALRLRNDLDVPRNEDEAYATIVRLLGELLAAGAIALPQYGFSTLGEGDFNKLLAKAAPYKPKWNKEVLDYFVSLPRQAPPSTEPRDIYADVIATFRSGPSEFNRRRADEPDFRKRSDEAQSLGVLR
jgi:hypothetical protein